MSIKKGIYAASLSVFNEDLSLDIDFTIKHAEKIIKSGAHGVCLLGSTGFSQYIDSASKVKLIDKIGDNKLKDNFIIGTGSNSLIENVRLMKHALENGINRFLLMPPAYYEYSDEGVYSYYANIIERVPECEILLYNFEKLSGYKFSVKIVEKLVKDFPKQIVGVKDSSYNLYENLEIPNFMIFPGSETKLLKGLELGCSGIITATCNATASLTRKVYDDFFAKKQQTHNEKLCNVRKVFDQFDLISGLHSFLMNKNKMYENILPPLSLLNSSDRKKLFEDLKKLNFNLKETKAA